MTLHDDMVALLEAGRAAEREVFGALDPNERDTPGPDGAWSPKDVQAHLSGWKARQTRRLLAAQRGETIEPLRDEEIDVVNAEMHAARASWPWNEVEADAERVSAELAAALRATDGNLLLSSEPLLGGTMGNGPNHALEHLPRVARGEGGLARMVAVGDEMAGIVRRGGMPETDVAETLYNLACFHALGGRLDRARALLPDAFGRRPDLVEWSKQDTDLEALRSELDELAGQ